MNVSNSTAMAVALKYLATSERFEKEIREKLVTFEGSEVDAVIADLSSKNIVNDRRTAESICRHRDGKRALGSYRLAYELRRRGAPEVIVEEFCGQLDEAGRAKSVLAGKFRTDPTLKPKAFRFLLSRGFSYETAHNAIGEFFAEDV